MEHPIEGVMTTAMEQLKEMVDVNTIIGDPVETADGSTIMTVSRVRFGFAAGGSDYQTTYEEVAELPFGGGSGGGVSITPVAFLIVGKDGIHLHHMNEGAHLLEKLMDMAPDTVSRITDAFRQDQSY
ncbi:spore protein [Jeotgalibacillus alimentarius]|uniref:Spore protein n=1 Tax=Jeotgalibacillus alimentarius TaxID=135826 RepID=A0A0C2WAY9_9BACL|nr:spore protein [Jeotgalibacillus alimentarius]MBM7578946.1 sporulation protein YtfJ [Jeotgalibacillus terrae]